jgi:hypothetical protein
MRDILIQSCAERVIAHAASKDGRCFLGFMKGLVNELYQGAPLMGISHNNINNKVRIIKGKGKNDGKSHRPSHSTSFATHPS